MLWQTCMIHYHIDMKGQVHLLSVQKDQNDLIWLWHVNWNINLIFLYTLLFIHFSPKHKRILRIIIWSITWAQPGQAVTEGSTSIRGYLWLTSGPSLQWQWKCSMHHQKDGGACHRGPSAEASSKQYYVYGIFYRGQKEQIQKQH